MFAGVNGACVGFPSAPPLAPGRTRQHATPLDHRHRGLDDPLGPRFYSPSQKLSFSPGPGSIRLGPSLVPLAALSVAICVRSTRPGLAFPSWISYLILS